MPTVHFLNVGKGDCSIIQHGSGRVSVIDICNGKKSADRLLKALIEKRAPFGGVSGDYGMRHSPTDPIEYLSNLRVSHVFRFILTHPDMDHCDGFKALVDEIGIGNFWDSGVRKEKPDFEGSPYNEADWDYYIGVRNGRYADITVVTPRSGSQFPFANAGDPEDRGDCLDVLAPSASLVKAANANGDPNDASYVLVYRTCGGKIVFPGDAHDETWEHVIENHSDTVANCAILIAPHHGRDSDRSYDFLDTLQPKLTLFGCAPSKDLAYSAWRNRGLFYITNNQAGNVLLEARSEGVDVYVENLLFAQTQNAFNSSDTLRGCYFIGRVPKD